MSCDVCLAPFDGQVEFYYEEKRRARKPHTCYEQCGNRIDVGAFYWRVGGKCEGEMWRASICVYCYEINNVFSCDGGPEFGNLWENMEYVFEDLSVRSGCLHQLSNEARAFLTAKWWDWKERRA